MDLGELAGLAAAALTTGAFVPQVWRTWRTRSAGDISAAWITLFRLGLALWLTYGIAVGSVPVILSNVATLALVGVIAWVKFVPQTAARRAA
jgi:MtN3 and saliva related transmembrane protein